MTGTSEPSTSFRACYEAHYRDLPAYALRRCTGRDDADDVVAEAFTVAWWRWSDVPDGSEARLWLFGVARNVMFNHRRSLRRRERLHLRAVSDRHGSHVDEIDLDDPERAVVHAALARLSQDDREVIRLAAWEELDNASILFDQGPLFDQGGSETTRIRFRRVDGLLYTRHQEGPWVAGPGPLGEGMTDVPGDPSSVLDTRAILSEVRQSGRFALVGQDRSGAHYRAEKNLKACSVASPTSSC